MKLPLDLNHELVKSSKVRAIFRFVSWQFKSRFINREYVYNWISSSKFYVKNGEKGLTQNIYVGLHEYEDMSFLLHALRQNDLFIDIGANSGSYSILAGAVCKAKVLSIEPIKTTYQRLIRNLALNNLENSSIALNIGLGAEKGRLFMTSGLDTTNEIVLDHTNHASEQVEITTLDEAARTMNPTLIKIDVEGWETNVLQGGLKTLQNPSLLGLIVELNESGTKYGYRDSEIVEFLANLDFMPFSYNPRNRILTSLSGKKNKGGNTIFIKSKDRVARIIESTERRKILDTWI